MKTNLLLRLPLLVNIDFRPWLTTCRGRLRDSAGAKEIRIPAYRFALSGMTRVSSIIMQVSIITLFILSTNSSNIYAQGFDEYYRVYEGDFNGDGETDLYIKQQPQIVILHGDIATPIVISPKPDVAPFILQQNPDQSFMIIGDLTASEKIILNQWTEAALELAFGDFNIDGIADVVLKGMGDVVPDALDQIVFADTAPAPPMHVRAMGSEFQQFFIEVNAWIVNPGYFEENAPTTTVTMTSLEGIISDETKKGTEKGDRFIFLMDG